MKLSRFGLKVKSIIKFWCHTWVPSKTGPSILVASMILVIVVLSFSELAISRVKSLKKISIPSSVGAMTPFFLKAKKSLSVSWIENSSNSSAVKFSIFENGQWTKPSTIVESKNLMANWADFPSIQKGGDTSYFAHWLEKNGDGQNGGYVIKMAKSDDDGKTWKPLGVLHKDRNEDAEHGFVSMVPFKNGVRAFWLDGQKNTGHHGSSNSMMSMQLRVVNVSKNIIEETLIDDRVCSCCGTTAVVSNLGPVIFYRDRTKKEIRDISRAYFRDGEWSVGSVSEDQWEIHGCPVNGPAADADGENVALAWYSGGGVDYGVKIGFSSDGSRDFKKRFRVDDFLTGSLGRVKIKVLRKSQLVGDVKKSNEVKGKKTIEALVIWMKAKGNGRADLYGRRVNSLGQKGKPIVIAEIGSSRAVGFPQFEVFGENVFLAWTNPSKGKFSSEIRMAKVLLRDIPPVDEVKKGGGVLADSLDEKKMGASLVEVSPEGKKVESSMPQSAEIKRSTSSFEVGEYLSKFAALDEKGQGVDLSKFKGKPVFINYWASWCDACIEELDYLKSLNKEFNAKGLQVVLVNVDEAESWEKARKILERASLNKTSSGESFATTIKIWRDLAQSGQENFGYSALPYSVVLDKNHKIRWSYTGSLLGEKEKVRKLLGHLVP